MQHDSMKKAGQDVIRRVGKMLFFCPTRIATVDAKTSLLVCINGGQEKPLPTLRELSNHTA
jgi:hypothetical protein